MLSMSLYNPTKYMNRPKNLSVSNLLYVLFFSLSFIVLPFFLSLLLIFFAISFNYSKTSQIDKIAAHSIAAYLSFINSTKTPSADLENYRVRFEEASDASMFNYIFIGENTKEPLFSLLNYIGYYLTFGSFQFFIFLISFLIFSLQFSALRRYCNYYNASSQRFFLCCLVLGMFFSYFSLTAHVVRQCLAISIVMYLLVTASTGGKLNKWLYVSTAFIHFISLFFFLIIFYKKFKNKLNFSTILKLGLLLLLLYTGWDTLILIGMSVFEPIQVFNYLFLRLADPSSFVEIGIGAATSSSQAFLSSIAGLIMIYTVFSLYYPKFMLCPLIAHAILLCCILVLFLSDYSLLQYRIFFIFYGFIPYLLIAIPRLRLNNTFSSVIVFSISIIIYSIFLNNVDNGSWDYASSVNLTMNNPLTLIFKYWT